jgi:phosphatidylinositol alpha-1,6-mannosyltransferase
MTRFDGKRVWLATEDYPPRIGGLSRWAENASNTLSCLGADVTVLAKKADPAEHRTLDFKVVGVRGRNFPKLRRFHFARAGKELAESEGLPDRIVASTWLVGEGFAGKYFTCPLTVAVHGLEVFRPHPRKLRRRLVQNLTSADHVVTASSFTADRLKEMIPEIEPAVGLNGADLELFTPEGDRQSRDFPIQLLSVGRLVERKGFDKVIEVVHAGREAGLDVGVWIVGEGPLRDVLLQQVEDLGVADQVVFLSSRGNEDLALLYRSADLFVSPCQSDMESGDVEGFGLTFAEAAACGTAAAALAEGGVTDAVEDGVSGILTSREDFVHQTVELLMDRERIERLGRQARQRAEHILDIRIIAGKLFPG